MSEELRQVDRVMLETLKEIYSEVVDVGRADKWREINNMIRALLTEQPEPEVEQCRETCAENGEQCRLEAGHWGDHTFPSDGTPVALTQQPEQDEAGERELLFLREHHAVTEAAIGTAKLLLRHNYPDQALNWLEKACTEIDVATVKYQPATARALGLAPEPVEQIRRDAEEVLPDSSTAQPHNERAQRSSGFDAGGVTGITEPAAPQPECEEGKIDER